MPFCNFNNVENRVKRFLCSQRAKERSPFSCLSKRKGERERHKRGKISISSQRLAAKTVCAQASLPDTQNVAGDDPLFSCLSKRKGEEKRTTQEGEDFDFFPLLTPLIETMKEGDTPSFKTPLHCAEREAFFL